MSPAPFGLFYGGGKVVCSSVADLGCPSSDGSILFCSTLDAARAAARHFSECSDRPITTWRHEDGWAVEAVCGTRRRVPTLDVPLPDEDMEFGDVLRTGLQPPDGETGLPPDEAYEVDGSLQEDWES